MDRAFSYSGLYAATVTDVMDPEQRGRVRLSIPELFLDPQTGEIIASPWCEAKGAWGPGAGMLNVPPVGSHVWVQSRFSDDGAIYGLVYEPGRFGAKEGTAHTPAVGKGQDDKTVELKAGVPFKVPAADRAAAMPSPEGVANGYLREAKGGDVRLEGIPPSANAGVYPQNRVLSTANGIVVELDDTVGAPRIHIWHPEGTYVEINAKGVWSQRQTKRWEETAESDTTYIGGDLRTRVDGHEQTSIGKNSVTEVEGRSVLEAKEINILSRLHLLMEAQGNFSLQVGGKAFERYGAGRRVVVGGDMNASWAGKGNFFSLGSTGIQTPGRLNAFSGMGITLGSPFGVSVGADPAAIGATPVALALPLQAIMAVLLAHTHPIIKVALPPVPGPIDVTRLAGPSVELGIAVGVNAALLPSKSLRAL